MIVFLIKIVEKYVSYYQPIGPFIPLEQNKIKNWKTQFYSSEEIKWGVLQGKKKDIYTIKYH